MNAPAMSVDDAAPLRPLAAGAFGAESSELEQSNTQLSCVDADNSLRRSPAYPTPAEPRSDLSTQTGHIPNNEESDEDECIDEFLADDGGQPLRNKYSDFPRPLRHAASDASMRTAHASAVLVSYGVLRLPLEEFCELIRQNRSLQRSEIISTETHCKTNGAVPHRFLLLELHREGKKDLWLRLDRRDRGVPFLRFAASLTTPSHDMAELAMIKNKLAGGATMENRQRFFSKPTLSELACLVNIFSDIIYRLFSTNCWFLPSQLQEYLGTRNGGYFVTGSQMHSDLAPEDRVRIAQRLALFDVKPHTNRQAQHGPFRVKSLESISLKAAPVPPRNLAEIPSLRNETLQQRRGSADGLEHEEIKQRTLDVDEILRRFQRIDHEIRTLCDVCAEHLDRSLHPTVTQEWAIPTGSPLAEHVGDSVSVEDYAFFTMLSIINREIYHGIFLPVHPAVAEDKTRPYGRQLGSVPLADAIVVQAKLFQGVDPKISVDREWECVRATAKRIETEILDTMRSLADERSLPPSFANTVQQILQSAYEWNRNIRQSIGKYAFAPFLVEPLSEWDPERMEPFERLRRMHISPGSQIIYPVSLGIMCSFSHDEDKARTLRVQQKAKVLVKEWFGARTYGISPRLTGETVPISRNVVGAVSGIHKIKMRPLRNPK